MVLDISLNPKKSQFDYVQPPPLNSQNRDWWNGSHYAIHASLSMSLSRQHSVRRVSVSEECQCQKSVSVRRVSLSEECRCQKSVSVGSVSVSEECQCQKSVSVRRVSVSEECQCQKSVSEECVVTMLTRYQHRVIIKSSQCHLSVNPKTAVSASFQHSVTRVSAAYYFLSSECQHNVSTVSR
nr:hypothetical protein BgiMline_024675 [Biomphalaria glabrata]